MLVQFAFIDMFTKWGLQGRSPDVKIDTWSKYATGVLQWCVLPAVLEEVIFRLGIFYGLVLLFRHFGVKHGDWLAVLLSSIAFAIYHWNWAQLVYQFILGAIFATAFLKTRNFLYPVLLHFINNFFVVTYTFIAGGGDLMYTWSSGYTVITAIVLAGLGGAIIVSLLWSLNERR